MAKVSMQALFRGHTSKQMQVLVDLLFVHISMMPHCVDKQAAHQINASFVVEDTLGRNSAAERSHQTMAQLCVGCCCNSTDCERCDGSLCDHHYEIAKRWQLNERRSICHALKSSEFVLNERIIYIRQGVERRLSVIVKTQAVYEERHERSTAALYCVRFDLDSISKFIGSPVMSWMSMHW
jgi:hypothetical protein